MSSPDSGRALDRAAVERVLARALELSEEQPGRVEGLPEERLLEIGRELGIPEANIALALRDERERALRPAETGLANRMAGPAHAVATRVVTGDPAALQVALDRWLRHEECLTIKRRLADGAIWESRQDLVSRARRSVRIAGRRFALRRASEVRARFEPDGEGRTRVHLEADLGGARARQLAKGGAVAAGGVAATAAAVAGAGVPLPLDLVPALLGAGGAAGVSRRHGRGVAAATDALERVLDRVEQREEPERDRRLARHAAGAVRLIGGLHRSWRHPPPPPRPPR
jgi:hypothetical protein